MASQNQPNYDQHLHKISTTEKFSDLREQPVQQSQEGMPSRVQKSHDPLSMTTKHTEGFNQEGKQLPQTEFQQQKDLEKKQDTSMGFGGPTDQTVKPTG